MEFETIVKKQEELESLKRQLKTAVETGSKLALKNEELKEHLTYFRNRASGLNQSTEFTFEKFYWEVVKRLNRIKP